MEHIGRPVDVDRAPAAVMMRAADCPSRLFIPQHSHCRVELVHVLSGRLCVTVDDTAHTVLAGQGLLIPPGTSHDMRMITDASVLTAYISMTTGIRYPAGCHAFIPSGLLRELMYAARDLPADYETDSRDGRIMRLILEEVERLLFRPRVALPRLPAPEGRRLRGMCRTLLAHLDHAWTIDEAAVAAGMGRRTFTRTFRRELGMTFATWCAHARLHAAAGRLATGASITEVAFASGYSSSSAFSTTFKRYLGVPPSVFQDRALPDRRIAG